MKRSGFSMIELVFVIVILGVLAAVAVPRFVATRTDAQVATARSDLASVQKAVVAKVFADNIDTTQANAPDPNKSVISQGGTFTMKWGDWIMEVGGLDGSRWALGGAGLQISAPMTIAGDNSIQPVGNVAGGRKGGCGNILGIDAGGAGKTGAMVFAPNNIGGTAVSGQSKNSFCLQLKASYESSAGPGNKVIPLASSGTVEF